MKGFVLNTKWVVNVDALIRFCELFRRRLSVLSALEPNDCNQCSV